MADKENGGQRLGEFIGMASRAIDDFDSEIKEIKSYQRELSSRIKIVEKRIYWIVGFLIALGYGGKEVIKMVLP